jgi:hypothetical protein
LEHTHRPTLEDYVHRATRLGSSRSLNLRIGINLHIDPAKPGRPAHRVMRIDLRTSPDAAIVPDGEAAYAVEDYVWANPRMRADSNLS